MGVTCEKPCIGYSINICAKDKAIDKTSTSIMVDGDSQFIATNNLNQDRK